jgi:ABC-type antimicrobial peptide transport system permease subunit
VMGIAVATVSLLVGALSLAKVMSPMVAQWTDGKEVVFGSLVVAALAGSYVVARTIARRAGFAVVTDETAGARPRRHG